MYLPNIVEYKGKWNNIYYYMNNVCIEKKLIEINFFKFEDNYSQFYSPSSSSYSFSSSAVAS